ncbi:aminotransferase class V-fold PLP-dependent enzyme [Yinghuangia soli]|uniref:Aminotransferase class V-fold PLP-dependent enzyme n=1 Tax=Yinghuangia soli TaxID=2908204 RepID=A0AA41U4R6_9ACTN|nr:aminotransferase class V-fold PLP-dependent enzyme [Yinghuangia soli]MCF2533236.1 aminotransferase class V-fold PLP-dependent enzyme [Yinghuangia soli]
MTLTERTGVAEQPWPHEDLAEAWRTARAAVPPGYLNAAACNVPSDAVLAAMAGHLDLERSVGGYEAAAQAGPVLDAGRAAIAAYVGLAAQDVGFVESGTVAMAVLLGGLRLGAGARVGVLRAEFGSNRMLLNRLVAQRGWTLVELAADGHSRLDLEALADELARGLDLVVFPHIASQHGIVQPAQEAGALCRGAGVPLVLDICQSLGHVEVGGVDAAAYVGTSRKWLAGPRGVGFVIMPGLAEGAGPDGFAPSVQSHTWDRPEGAPVAGALRFQTDEASVAGRVGLAVAVQEHRAAGPGRAYARLAAAGQAVRHTLDGVGGWRAVEPLGEPSAIVTLRPPAGADPQAAVQEAAAKARAAGITVGAIPVSRAPSDMPTPVLRVSPLLGSDMATVAALAAALAR